MSEPQRLIFHIGLEKTGTSSLQACLHHNSAILRRHSIIYPRRNAAYGYMNHKPLVGCYAIEDVGDRWLKVDPSRREATVASIIGEIEAAPERIAVISAEHFSSRFRMKQIRALRADFDRFDCSVTIVVRDHLARLCSSYETFITNGGTLSLAGFADGMMAPNALDLRYADLIAPWEQVFGGDRIRLLVCGPEVIRDALSSISPGLGNAPNLRMYRHNVSAGADVVAALRLANVAAAHEVEAGVSSWVRNSQLRDQIKAWLRQSSRGTQRATWSLDTARLARLTEIARHDVAQLEARYGLKLAPQEAPIAAGNGEEAAAADLLARALVTRAAKPWSKASLTGAAVAATFALRDKIAVLRRR